MSLFDARTPRFDFDPFRSLSQTTGRPLEGPSLADLSVQHDDLHVVAAGDGVVDAAVADVVGPAVPAEHPHGGLREQVFPGTDFFWRTKASSLAELIGQKKSKPFVYHQNGLPKKFKVHELRK